LDETAGEVAKQTGIGRPTVSTTLTKLVSEGAAVKAERGYKLDARSRTEAVARGRQLGLLAPVSRLS
jgi:DNA-binding CsgD family transcriptional regulator